MSSIKDIETYVDLRIQEVKSHSRNWLIACAVACVLVIILFITVFKPKQTTDPKIEGLKNEIEELKHSNQILDSLIKVKGEELKTNRTTETKLKTKYDKVPTVVNDLSRDELRRELTKYDY